MNTKLYIFGAVVLALIAGYVFVSNTNKQPVTESLRGDTTASKTTNSSGEPTFTWSYETDESGDVPSTVVYATATYEDGTSVRKEIDTVQGTCATHPDPAADAYGATQIICYYAGFGTYYKVVASGDTYAVQRQEFEEASPDYQPPVAAFETIVTF